VPSSISASDPRTATRALLVLLAALLAYFCALEAVTRLAFPRINHVWRGIQADHLAAVSLRPDAPDKSATMLIVGNSYLDVGVKRDTLQMEIAPSYSPAYLPISGTSYLDWYFGLRRLFAEGSRPAFVGVCLSMRDLVSDATSGGSFANSLMLPRDILRVKQESHLDNTTMSDYFFADFSSWMGHRGEIHNWLLRKSAPEINDLVPYFRPKNQPLPPTGDIVAKALPRLRLIVYAPDAAPVAVAGLHIRHVQDLLAILPEGHMPRVVPGALVEGFQAKPSALRNCLDGLRVRGLGDWVVQVKVHGAVGAIRDIESEERIAGATALRLPPEDIPPRRIAVWKIALREVIPHAVVEFGMTFGFEPAKQAGTAGGNFGRMLCIDYKFRGMDAAVGDRDGIHAGHGGSAVKDTAAGVGPPRTSGRLHCERSPVSMSADQRTEPVRGVREAGARPVTNFQFLTSGTFARSAAPTLDQKPTPRVISTKINKNNLKRCIVESSSLGGDKHTEWRWVPTVLKDPIC